MYKGFRVLAPVIIMALIIAMVFQSKPDIYISNSNKIISVPEINLPQYSPQAVPHSTGDISVVILGSDEREDEISRSDVIMLAKYKEAENKLILVSIPRDCKVAIPRRGMCKINSAYAYGGARLQARVIEELFKLNGLNYIHFNFEGFKKIIDSLGGVRVFAEKDFKSIRGKKRTYAVKGENILYGNELLEYVRFRYDKDGDFGRIKRQQQVLKSIYKKFAKPGELEGLTKAFLVVAKNSDSNMDIFFW
ncbi:MAG: LCP family protein [Pseudomonadota bacterium]